MEKGVISSNGMSIVWSEKPIPSLWSGERLTKTVWAGTLAHMDGYRCVACMLIVANYQKQTN